MIKKLFVATGNAHKLEEIRAILKDFGLDIELICPKDIHDDSEPVEDGKTFRQNASIKAHYWYSKTKLPTIADDSGICIEYFNNFPGIYSARFMKDHTYKEKNALIIKAMDNADNRKAAFHCALSYINEKGEEKLFEGILKGSIATRISGKNGFGYDPIFYIEKLGKTAGELTAEEKNRISHRSLAFRKWAKYVKNN